MRGVEVVSAVVELCIEVLGSSLIVGLPWNSLLVGLAWKQNIVLFQKPN